MVLCRRTYFYSFTPLNLLNLKSAFTFPFKVPKWIQKIGIIAMAGIIPIAGPLIWFGWGLEIAAGIIYNREEQLPKLDILRILGYGFQGLILLLIYSIPIFLFAIPFWITPFIPEFFNESTSSALSTILTFTSAGLILISFFIEILILPAVLGNFIAANQVDAGLRFGEVFRLIKATPRLYLVLFFCTLLGEIVALLGILPCLIGILITSPLISTWLGHLYGQTFRKAAQLK
jgi:hypothetical protein